jgi:hypothetical protein
MNDLIRSIPRDYKPKSFWERPEGLTGQIVGMAALGAAGYGLYLALPALIRLLENTLYAALLGVAAVMAAYVMTDRRFWRLGSYLYQSLMRKITQLFVEIDPIGIMQTYAADLDKKLAVMGTRIATLSGLIRACQDEISKNERIRGQSLQMVKEATRAGKTLVVAEESRQAGRMQEANLTYQDLLAKMQLLYTVLVKYQDVSRFLVKDIRREIDIKKRRKQMTDAAHSAIRAAKSIINGDADARAMFDLADEYLAHDYAMKIGEIEDFMRMSDSFVSAIDLQNGVYASEALKTIEEWERRGDSILLGADAKRLLVESSYSTGSGSKEPKPGDGDPGNREPRQWF